MIQRTNNLFPLVICSVLLIGSLAACKQKKTSDRPRENPPTQVDVMVAKAQAVSNVIEANGTIIANESVDLRPEVNGRLTYLNIPEGKQVAQGTVLARVNSADLQAQLDRSRVQLQLAETTVKRLRTLLDVGGVNQSDYDLAVNQANTLRADMEYTRTLIDKTVIRAPFSGVIGLRQVSPGAYVSPATIIASMRQLTRAKVDFTLPEQYSNMIRIGGVVEVEVDVANTQRERAQIVAMEPEANRQTRNVIVRAVLERDIPNPGAFVKVYVGSLGNDKRAIMVPTNSIIQDDKNNQVIVVKGAKANYVTVTTGARTESNVEITQGLNEGDTVVVTGVLFTRPNSAVKIKSVKTLDQLGTAK